MKLRFWVSGYRRLTDSEGLTFKRTNVEGNSAAECITINVYQKFLENISQRREGVNTQLVVSRMRWAKMVTRIRD